MRAKLTSAVILTLLLARGSSAQEEPPRLVVQTGGPMPHATLSPDGRLLLTGGSDARIWDVASGKELRRLKGHGDFVSGVSFSPDGKSALTGGDDTARTWDVASGAEILRFPCGAPVCSVAFSPDGRFVLTTAGNDAAELWNASSGEKVRRFPHRSASEALFSPDGTCVLTRSCSWKLTEGGTDGLVRLWDVSTERELLTLRTDACAIAFAPDGRWVVTGNKDATARVWDVTSGMERLRLVGHARDVVSVAVSPDGRTILTGSWDDTMRLWDASSGNEIRRSIAHDIGAYTVGFSADGRYAFHAGEDCGLWDVRTGKELRRFTGGGTQVLAVACSPVAPLLLTGLSDGTARFWDLGAGREVRRLDAPPAPVPSVAFSPDGRTALTGSFEATTRLWDVSSGTELRRFQGRAEGADELAFSADGRLALMTSDMSTRIVDVASGEELRSLPEDEVLAFSPDARLFVRAGGQSDESASLVDTASGAEVCRLERAYTAAFAPDGRALATAGWGDGFVRLCDVPSGKSLRRLEGHSAAVLSIVFSPDGAQVLTGSSDYTARLWDVATGRELHRFQGHGGMVTSVAFSADQRHVFTGSHDGAVRVWSASTGRELCRLVSFRDGPWAVVDEAGRYDASNGGDVEWLHWVVGDEPIALDQFKERYYDPGLLAKHMGLSKEPLREVKSFTAPRLFPATTLEEKDGKLLVRLSNRGGGIGRVVVKVNGVECLADARDPAADPNAKELSLALDLSEDPRLRPGEPNRIEVFAFNAEGYLRSRGIVQEWTPSGEARKRAPELWAVVAGVSDYRGDAIDLRYAAKDAADFAAALSVAGERLFGRERLHLSLPEAPTRTVLVGALEAARAAKPEDVLVVYLAGHGVNFGGPEGDYHFLCADAASADLKDPAVRSAVALSSAELTALLNAVPALKRVLVLDTCASGRLVEKLSEARDIPSSQVRAMERLKDRTGFFVIAGCASDRVSYEASRYGQGLLTYSLLLGMRGAALREEEYVDVSKLFGYAADRVPELAAGIGGIQRPVLAAPRGGASFDVGRLTGDDKAKVPLQAVRPMVLRSNFQDERRPRDTLGLAKLVDERLREASARGRDAPLVFVDASEFPDACEIGGRYRVEGGKVSVEVTVFRGEEEIGRFAVAGSDGDLAALAASIVRKAERHLK